ncbi:hypothetical protein V1517DRAFT_368226 [Lipomyces orientalis]|uniref:Uncharacterized protein n=1 Tax=Lipomyces orientalis TaxID=1233043 RepID=A0ACC3TKH9_9ASCO
MCTTSRNSVLPLHAQKALDNVTRQLWLLASLGLKQDERFMPPLSGERYVAALQIVINNLHSLVSDAKLQIDEILPPSTTEGSQPKRFRVFVQSILGTIADGIDMDKLEKIVGDNMTNIMPNMVVLPFTHTNNMLREDELDEILGLSNTTSLGNAPPHSEALDLCETEVTASAETNEVLPFGSDNQRSSCPPHESNLTTLNQQQVDHLEQEDNQPFQFRTYLFHSNRQSGLENFSDSAAEAIATGMAPFFGSTSESASPGSEPTSSLRLEIGSQVSYIARFTEEDMNSIINPSEPPERTNNSTPTPASERLESFLSPVFVATERNARRLVPRRRRVASRGDQTYNYKMRRGLAFTWIGKVYGQGMAGRSDDLGRVTVITKYTKYFVLNTLSSSQFALANKVFENMLQLIILEKMKIEKGVEYLVKKGDLTVPNTFTTYLLNIQRVARKLASILQIEMVDPYQLDPFILTSDFGEAHGRYSEDGTSMGMLMECTVSRTTNDKILFSRRSPYIHFETCEGYSGQMFHLCPRVFEPFFVPEQVSWKLVPDLPWLVYDERQMQFLGIAPNFQQKTVLQTTLIATYMWHGVFREVQQPIELEIDLGQDADFGQLPGLLSVHHNIFNIDDVNRETQRQVIAKQGEAQISREPSDLHITEVHQADQSTEAIRCQINTVVAEIVPSYEETMSLSTQPIREFISNNEQSTAKAAPNSDMRSASQGAGMGIDGNNSTVRTPTADDAISSDVTHILQNTNHPPQPILSLNTSDIYDVSIVPMVAFEDKDDSGSLDSLNGIK